MASSPPLSPPECMPEECGVREISIRHRSSVQMRGLVRARPQRQNIAVTPIRVTFEFVVDFRISSFV